MLQTIQADSAFGTDLYQKLSTEFDRQVLSAVLDMARNNATDAAQLLGISRTTLLKKLRGLGLKAGQRNRAPK